MTTLWIQWHGDQDTLEQIANRNKTKILCHHLIAAED